MTLLAAAIAWLASLAVYALGIRPAVAGPLAILAAIFLPALTSRRRALHAGFAALAVAFAVWRLGPANSAIPTDSLGRLTGSSVHLLVSADADADPHPTYVAVYAHARSIASAGEWHPVSGGVSLLLPATAAVRRGDVLDVRGELETPGGANDGYSAWLQRRGVVASLAFPRLALVTRPPGHGISSLWRTLRDGLDRGLGASLPPNETALASALLFGNRHALPPDLSADLNISGASHIAVISAFNLMLLYGAVSAGLAPLIGRRRSLVLGVFLAVAYGSLAGQSATVMRGEVLVAVLAVAALSGRPHSSVTLLVLAAAAITLVSPSSIDDAGFQLTFAAAGGISILAPRLQDLVRHAAGGYEDRLPFLVRATLDSLLVSLAVALAIVPVSAATFGTVSLVSPLANAAIIPAIPAATLLALLTGLTGWMAPWLAVPAAGPLWLVLRFIEAIAHATARLPFAALDMRAPALPFALGWYGVLVAIRVVLPRLVRTRRRLETRAGRRPAGSVLTAGLPAAYLTLGLLIFAAAGLPVSKKLIWRPSNPTTLRWLDGTRGEAVLVTGRNGARVLLTVSESPAALAQALERTTGRTSVDAVIAPRGRAADAGWQQVGSALHAAKVLLPSGGAVTDQPGSASTSPLVVPVPGSATMALGPDDRVELLTLGSSSAIRVVLGTRTLIFDAGSALPALDRWQASAATDALVDWSAGGREIFAATTLMRPALVFFASAQSSAITNNEDQPPLPASMQAATRLIDTSKVREVQTSAAGSRLRVQYRER